MTTDHSGRLPPNPALHHNHEQASHAAASVGRFVARRGPDDPEGPACRQRPIYLPPTRDPLEETVADAVFVSLLDFSDADLRHAFLEGIRAGNGTAIQQLGFICGRLIQFDAGRARMMAELAVEWVEGHREIMGEEADHWKAVAWARLALICLATGDDGAADRALGFAWEEVGDAGMKDWSELEVRRVEGRLRMKQRRHEEAERAFDRAVEIARGLPPRVPDRAQAVLERLELATGLRDAETGFRLATELEELIEGYDQAPSLWRGFVAYHRGMAHAAAGNDGCADAWLRQTVQHVVPEEREPRPGVAPHRDNTAVQSRGLIGTFAIHELARIAQRDGRLDHCESLLRLAADRYRHFAIPVFRATTEAEQAVMCALLGRKEEARRLAKTAARFLDDLPLHRRAWSAARRLRSLADGGASAPGSELTALLADLQGDLDVVRWEIAGAQAVAAVQARKERE